MIELRHLRYFIAVAEELNFRRAAERVHIDQTPLSRTIRDLEDRWNVQLFVRGPRKLHLTPAGQLLLEEARELLIRVERIKHGVLQTHALYRAPLRVGIADGMSQPNLPECFNSWRAALPGTPLELLEIPVRELLGALKAEQVDVGFSFGMAADQSIVQWPTWSHRLMAVLPCNHELAGQSMVSLPELLAYPLLSFSEDGLPGLRSQVQAIVHGYVTHPVVSGDAHSLPGYVTRVASGLGLGVLDAGHALALQRSDVVVRPIAEEEHIITFAHFKLQRSAGFEPAQSFLTHIKVLS